MDDKSKEPVYSLDGSTMDPTYLDIQAEVGISKHFGGYSATNTLHKRCHLDKAKEVLEVGCGTGIGAVYMARQYGCRVEAVDISEKMLSWAWQRAKREGIADKVRFRKADIRELPFGDDRFDVVIVESVLAFVEDKKAALLELIRVTRPGGYIGLNEYCWTSVPPEEIETKSVFIGMSTITDQAWVEFWEGTGLVDQSIDMYTVAPRQEFRDRISWVGGWGSIFKIWGRVIKLLVGNPEARDAIKQQLDMPPEVSNLMGYLLLTGRKP